MARNAEKAKSMLNRFWAQKNGVDTAPKKRPRFVAKVGSLKECEEWRLDVIKEISKNITAIQNPILQEDAIRALNDEINKLIREKGAWERHIRSLGGPDYARSSNQLMNDGGALGSGGYRYFGAAKNLPGVRELLEQRDDKQRTKATGGDVIRGDDGRPMRDIRSACDAAYFGYDELYRSDYVDSRKNLPTEADEDPNADARARYLAQERNAERRLRQEQIDAWRDRKRRRRQEENAAAGGDFEANPADDNDDDDDDDDENSAEPAPVSAADIEAAILKRKKEALLRQFVSKEVRDSVELK